MMMLVMIKMVMIMIEMIGTKMMIQKDWKIDDQPWDDPVGLYWEWTPNHDRCHRGRAGISWKPSEKQKGYFWHNLLEGSSDIAILLKNLNCSRE